MSDTESRTWSDGYTPAPAGATAVGIAVLDPDVVFRADRTAAEWPVLGAAAVARRILARGTTFAPHARPAIVNGEAGIIVQPGSRVVAVVGFTVAGGRIVEIDLVTDPAKRRRVPVVR